jgi:hypothetical protein
VNRHSFSGKRVLYVYSILKGLGDPHKTQRAVYLSDLRFVGLAPSLPEEVPTSQRTLGKVHPSLASSLTFESGGWTCSLPTHRPALLPAWNATSYLEVPEHRVVFNSWKQNPHGVGSVVEEGNPGSIQVAGQLMDVRLQLSKSWHKEKPVSVLDGTGARITPTGSTQNPPPGSLGV